MKRKILLIEPNYSNKYPPIGLMKIATYFRTIRKDDVRFFKGDLREFSVDIILDDLIRFLSITNPNYFWKDDYLSIRQYIKTGKLDELLITKIYKSVDIQNILCDYRKKYLNKEYFKRFDFVGITTLFTFYWQITIDTINFAKRFAKDSGRVMIGGVMSSILPDKIEKEVGIRPFVGQLGAGAIDKGDKTIIDELPLDYSILDEIDYQYPVSNAYFAYMTRGCINKCKFCAVPVLEPEYKSYIGISDNIKKTIERFGEKKDLLLLDNNVLASKKYNSIINEIQKCGFYPKARYIENNQYLITLKNLKEEYNTRACVRKIINIYKSIYDNIQDEKEKIKFYKLLKNNHCLYHYTATKNDIVNIDKEVKNLYKKYFKPKSEYRYVDFNQGIDSRLVNDSNMDIMSKIGINPLRIAFDHWNLKDVYLKSVKCAIKHGITHLSNYLLYNFEDKPEELYYRLRLNVDICERTGANIYSFPMKYHPIKDEKFFNNRDYIGKYWNRKFIRAIQAILNSTKGKVGRGKEFFEEAFGKNITEYRYLLWMPESFIIYRRKYNKELRNRLKDKYPDKCDGDCDLANEWKKEFKALSPNELKEAKRIISMNDFSDIKHTTKNKKILSLLKYYLINRNK